MKKFQTHSNKLQKSFNAHRLPTLAAFGYALPATAKSVAEPRNSNNLSLANIHTRQACFFIRCTRTPQENASSGFLSMVACSGKGFALCCVPVIAVFEPVTRYRPQASKLQAVALIKISLELSQMLFKFLLLGSKRLTISIRANTEQEARQRLQFTAPALCVARYNQGGRKPQQFTNFAENQPACTLAPQAKSVYSSPAFAKNESTAVESCYIHEANSSTPLLNRAFFVCNTRTPKENAPSVLLSMVACNGQPLVAGCFPCVAVFHPVTRYRQAVESKAIALIHKVTVMLFKFLCVHRNQPTYTETKICVQAPNLNEARWALPADYRLLIESPIASLPNGADVADFYAKPTACPSRSPFAQGLPNGTNARNIGDTTNQSGSRSRYTSGIFLSQIPQDEPLTQSLSTEFAVRATLGNKAEFIRTNNEGCSLAVVEPLPHPIEGGNPLLKTKENNPMKTQSSPVCTMGAYPHNAFSPFAMGVANA